MWAAKNAGSTLLFALVTSAVSCVVVADENGTTAIQKIEQVIVWGDRRGDERQGYTSPVSTLSLEDLVSINLATTEDAVKYEPSLVIRRRFIGDSNGTLGMRGSNMFQTSRSMVFADGVPLHYLLESRWNGAPRWTMVSASEIAQVNVVYGPFSAEYSGNTMGGVVLIETEIPQERHFHIDGMFFAQAFDDVGFDDRVDGFKGFASYGDKMGDLSFYLSYNHLHNDSQPMTFYSSPFNTATTGVTASGGIKGEDAKGNEKLYYGDTGVVDTTTDNVKAKLGYDFGNWFALLNVVYEDRQSESVGTSYIRDTSGALLWSGMATQDGDTFTIKASSLGASEQVRHSLNAGLRLKGDLTDSTHMEVNLSTFAVLKDETGTSNVNPEAAYFDGSGSIKDYDDTGWQTAEAKWTFDALGTDSLGMVTGVRYEAYRLNINTYDSNQYASGSQSALTDSSGGKTSLAAAFAQFNWTIDERWDSTFGLRYEAWESHGGYYTDDDAGTPTLDLVHTPSRTENHLSPKFSLGVMPADHWTLRYSLARAYRFPIVEELYSQYEAYTTKSLANPDLKPENGLHHNLMIEYGLVDGYLRVNLYRENIKDVIDSQTDTTVFPTVRTFVPVDEVDTTGIEVIANINHLMLDDLDVRFNLAYTDSEIVNNVTDPSIEGNRFPRMPEWRSNLLLTYHLNAAWDVGGSVQYASDSFGQLDNTDTVDKVYGAQDAYTHIGLKTTYQLNQNATLGFGVDNLTNDIAYVAHPWPGRTLYLNLSYDL